MAEYFCRGKVSTIKIEKGKKISIRVKSNVRWDSTEGELTHNGDHSFHNVFWDKAPSPSLKSFVTVETTIEIKIKMPVIVHLLKLAREEEALFGITNPTTPPSSTQWELTSLTVGQHV
jgi:hypothetical protein